MKRHGRETKRHDEGRRGARRVATRDASCMSYGGETVAIKKLQSMNMTRGRRYARVVPRRMALRAGAAPSRLTGESDAIEAA